MSARTTIPVRCLLDFEQTPESLHAHAVPQDVEIMPGDQILLHDVPAMVGFGEHLSGECRGTLIRANWFERTWTELRSIFEIGELYEVGFQPVEDFAANTVQIGG